MSLPKTVKIVEVGPRDGLQNEPNPVSTEIKLALIHRLAEAGLPVVEATSFVSPQWVPQMADHQAVMAGLQRRPGTRYPVLVPNARGMENALAAGVDEIAIFIAASEAFSQKNLNCSIEKSFERYQQVMAIANVAKLPVRAYISCVIDCPYAGATPPEQVAELAERLIQLGCYEISLGETIGTGTPKRAQRLIEVVSQSVPLPQLAVHFHNTYGQALANIYAVLELSLIHI